MAAPAPVAIGTRGTVGSLVMREIEYFTKFESDTGGSTQNPQPDTVEMVAGSGRSHSRPSFWLLLRTWKRKKRRATSGFLPKICSVAEVADRNQFDRIPGYSYRILKNDINRFQL